MEKFRPFLSKDLDLLMTTAEGRQIAEATGWEFLPPEPDAQNVQGRLQYGPMMVELLATQDRPLLPPELRWLSQPTGSPPILLKLVSPELLLVGKAALAVTVPQDGSVEDIAPRQDLRHVRMLALVVPHYLADAMESLPDDKVRAAAIQPILAILASVQRGRTGRRFEERYPGVLRWGELLPTSVRALPLDDVYRWLIEQLDQADH